MDFIQNMKDINQIKGSRINKGLDRILNRNKDVKPSFSYTWIRSNTPKDEEKIKEYEINDNIIQLYHIVEESEDLYHIIPPEYEMNKKEAELIYKVKESLSKHYPRDTDIINTEQVKEYILSQGKNLLIKTAQKMDFDLGESKEKELKRAEELSKILSKYTAGYGILEILLKDQRVEDIYIDAPSEKNSIYIEISG